MTLEMLQLLGGSLTTAVGECSIDVTLRVPAAGKTNVVIVDDNQDFVHFCRRCVRGTRFRLLQPAAWTVTAILDTAPDAILLDIMLPDVDGWELLQALQREPSTASIPVIICSIVREEALATALGAVRYLPKPMLHQDLLATLERSRVG
jgi:CheY-like chemotaxis protein